MQAEFERDLAQKIRARRLTMCIVCLLFFTACIVSWILLETTKEVIVHGGPSAVHTWERERYNLDLILPLIIGLVGTIYCAISLLVDFLACRFQTIRKDMQYITIYRGMLHSIVYVDGREMGRIEPFMPSNVVEVRLANQVKVTISFSRTIWYMAHVSFSDDTASREV